MAALKWAWVHGSLEVDEFGTLDEAVEAAHYASDYGTESLDCIEVLGDRIYSSSEVWKLAEPIAKREAAEWKARPAPVARVEVRSPVEQRGELKWTTVDWLSSLADADREAKHWTDIVGEDRVRVEPMKRAA